MMGRNIRRLTQFIASNTLRQFLYDSELELKDMDPEIINLVFQLESATKLLEEEIKLMYIKKYWG